MTDLNVNQTTLDDEYTDPTSITKRLMQTREKLMDPEAPAFYLGDPAKFFKNQVVWKRVGNGNRLVTKESATAVEKKEETQSTAPNSDHSPDAMSIAITDTLLQPALFSAIVLSTSTTAG